MKSEKEIKTSMKTIVITGGSSGIGKAIALEMAKDNYVFYLIGRNKERLQKVCQKLEELGSIAFWGIADVGNAADITKIFDEINQKLNSVDVLIANAGIGYFGLLEELSLDEYNAMFDTNVKGVFLVLKKVLPIMKKQDSGQIIVTSSNLGLTTSARTSLYAATKHAVQAMVGALRDELKGTMVKAATINPGSVSTPWFDGKNVVRERMLSAEDVAKVARLIITQNETSNIDHILLLPGKV
jgi:NADP-dependent 3-hydroxy acid dehydrogenase YdfG